MACICTHLSCLISGASAVRLVPRPAEGTRLLRSSISLILQVMESWAGPGNEATVVL